MSGLTEFIWKVPLEFLSSQTAPGSFCRLRITVTQDSSTNEPQPNRPSEAKPSIARLTRIASSRAMSSSPSPSPAGAIHSHLCTAASQPASWTYRSRPGSQITTARLARPMVRASHSYGAMSLNFNGFVPSMIFNSQYLKISPTVTDYRGHRRTIFPVRGISKHDLRLDYSAGTGIEPRTACTCARPRPINTRRVKPP